MMESIVASCPWRTEKVLISKKRAFAMLGNFPTVRSGRAVNRTVLMSEMKVASAVARRSSSALSTGSLASRFIASASAACDSNGTRYHASIGPVTEVREM